MLQLTHRRWLVVALVLLLVPVILLACGPTDEETEPPEKEEEVEEEVDVEPDTKYGGQVVMTMGSDLIAMSPTYTGTATIYPVKNTVFDSIVRMDSDGVPQPHLATDWDISSDGLEITFYLRDDVVFHDGEPFDAHDVYFTYMLCMYPPMASSKHPYLSALKGYRDFWESIGELSSSLEAGDISDDDYQVRMKDYYEAWSALNAIEVVDDYTITFHFSEPSGSFMTVGTEVGIVASHLLEGHEDYIMETDYVYNPIGTGPFYFAEWERGEYWILKAFEDHWAGRPYLDQMITRVIPDATTRLHEFLAGNLDYFVPPVADLQTIMDTAGKKVLDAPGVGWAHFSMNLERGFFGDVRVRQAIHHMIDKQAMHDHINEGWHQVAHHPFNPGIAWCHVPMDDPFPLDLDKAAELLIDAGFTEQADGWYKDGERLEFTVRVSTGELAVEAVTVLQQFLARANVRIEIDQLDLAAWQTAIFASDFDMMYFGWTGHPDPDAYIRTVHHSDGIGGRNVMLYRNDRVDELFEKAGRVFDLEDRAVYYREMQEILAMEVPKIYFNWASFYHAFDEDLEGAEPHPYRSQGIFFSLKDWYWDR